MRRNLSAALILLAAGLLVVGLMGYEPAHSGSDLMGPFCQGASYPLQSRIIAAVGAIGLAGRLLLRKGGSPGVDCGRD
jgi:hypothetical protein